MRFAFRKYRFISILVALVTAAGCSKEVPVADVHGVIKMDGKPMPHTKVMFMPDPQKGTVGPISAGLTDDEGRFTLTCEDSRSGAVVGWHKVVVLEGSVNLYRTPRNGRRDDDEPVPKAKPRKAGPKVPEKYTTAGKTPLEMEVKQTKNDLEIALTH